jgi:phosphoglycolate phosphatase-like HAD superfamily hydrolase
MGKAVCVDLNGVLDTYTGWQGEVTWHEPRAGAAEFLQSIRERGYTVVVLTVRYPGDARAWLEEHGLLAYVDEVTNQKPAAFAYIDDRAVCFRGEFDETLRELDAFRPHWRPQSEEEG